jgi:hypothetical protein
MQPRRIVDRIVDNPVDDTDNRPPGRALVPHLVDIAGSTPEELAAFHRAELAKWARIVKDSGAKLD